MYFSAEQARTQCNTAKELLLKQFKPRIGKKILDSVFFSAYRNRALGFAGLPYEAPVCGRLLNRPAVASWIERFPSSQLFLLEDGTLHFLTEHGEEDLPGEIAEEVMDVYRRVLAAPGELNEKGELLLDLKTYPVGPHYPVNLLLGDRAGYPYPLCTTPKSALDALGRGSFRATGGQQVLATRCVLALEENGEPPNRQFYLVDY